MRILLVMVLSFMYLSAQAFKDTTRDNAIKQYMWKASNAILEPEIHYLINDIAAQIPVQDKHKYEFFVIDKGDINAFATQYGMIGINAGLITASENEEELLSVVAHEIGHIYLNHFERLKQSDAGGLLALGGVVLAGITKNNELSKAIFSSALASEVQTSINWTRRFEEEADNFAKEELRKNGMNSNAMSNFFLRLEGNKGEIEYLRTHPLSINRATNSFSQEHKDPKPDSFHYTILKALLSGDASQPYIQALRAYQKADYTLALAFAEHVPLHPLRQVLVARIYSAQGKYEQAIAALTDQSNISLYYRAKALFASGNTQEAIALLKTRNFQQPDYFRYMLLEEFYTNVKQLDKYYYTIAQRHELIGDIATAKIKYALAKKETQNRDLRLKIDARLSTFKRL